MERESVEVLVEVGATPLSVASLASRVCEAEKIVVSEGVGLGVCEGLEGAVLGYAPTLMLPVCVTPRDGALVALAVSERLGDIDALAPKDKEDELSETVADGDDKGDPDGVAEVLPVRDTVIEAVTLSVNVAVGVMDEVAEDVGDTLGDAPNESVLVGVPVCDEDRFRDDDKLTLNERV